MISVEAGKSVDIIDIPKNTYSYETTYEVPTATISSKAEGAVSDDVNLLAGTKILVLNTSTFVQGVYAIGASISSSDDLINFH